MSTDDWFDIYFVQQYLNQEEADRLFQWSQKLDWRQNSMRMYGKEISLPRLEIMFGDPGCSYRYGNVFLEPMPWAPELLELRDRLEADTRHQYHVAIGNLYRSGADHIGWHSDDSPEMGNNPAIASISLGATRRFDIRHKVTREAQSFLVASGDQIFMPPGFQEVYKHRLFKSLSPSGVRINWTFRPHVNGVVREQLSPIAAPMSNAIEAPTKQLSLQF